MSEQMRTWPLREVIVHQEGLKSFRFDRAFDVEPGQFITLWLPGVDEKPFALSAIGPDWLEITIRAVGPFTRRMMDASPGTWLGLRGPFGKGFRLADRTLIVGGGCGNAPLRFLAQRLGEAGRSYLWLAGGRTRADLLFANELATDPHVWAVTEDGSTPRKGLVTDFWDEARREMPSELVCAAGPEPMLLAVRERCTPAGLDFQLSFERYMKCGIGLCGQCSLDGSGVRLCVEGPVLGPADILGIAELGKPHRGPSGRRPASS